MNNAPTLQAGNLLLRKPKHEDIQGRFLCGKSAEFVRMCGGDRRNMKDFTLEDASSWYEKAIQHPCEWVVEFNDKLIGMTRLTVNNDDNRARLSISIFDENFLGKGLGTKIINIVLDYAFNILNLHRVDLRVLEYNKRAIRCYEKCGFIKEGIEREGAYIEDKYESDIMMSILQHEYAKK